MINLKDFVQENELNNEFENILFEDLRILLLCLQKTSVEDFYWERYTCCPHSTASI